MFSLFRKRREMTTHEPMTVGQGKLAAHELHSMIMSVGCLLGNVATLGQQLSLQVTEGNLTEIEMAELINSIRSAGGDAERACLKVSKMGDLLSPSNAEDSHGH